MLQVGIFTAYLPYSLDETARRIKELGFNTVQVDLIYTDMDMSTEAITREKCIKIRDTYRHYNLPISCISNCTNLVHPDPVKRARNLDRLKTIIRHAHDLGSPYVPSETGTFNPDSDWSPHPRNQTEAGYEECRDVIADIVTYAREHGVTFVIEPYVNNVIGSVERTLRLFAEIDDPHLGLAMDPTNYFEVHNIGAMDETLNHVFNALSRHIKYAHAKDVKMLASDQGVQMADVTATEGHSLRGVGSIELPPPGLGVLNYDLYLQRLAKDHLNTAIIIEHLDEQDIPRAKAFLDAKLMANGL